ncbi:Mu-like prophage major head subunit gpT family protein [Salmonella enterica]|uniref:Head protein n=1 Tax=Salmonella enterica TaxID=28901 RepID=A0A747H855_SALER|nr:head protein [Salmonella enterica]ECC2872168.1 head protein [Salmonella enterica subsp. enterica serovar Tanger]EDW1890372.1 head protein [Salmonella enterica subsp. enterica serovar Abaetetuba]EAP9213115.1 head protein [Salmonella enterica]EAT6760362.1 head protein [Salmonella enterica]
MPTPITPAIIASLMTGFRADFKGGISDAPSQYKKITMTVPSVSKSNTYGWLGKFPQFREWVGSRVVQQMAAHGYAIVNKTWEDTVSISRDDFEDDAVGIYAPMFEEMGRACGVFPDELVFKALTDGIKTACYDGQNFFDAEHPVYPSVDGTGTPEKVPNLFISKDASGAAYTGPTWYLLDCSRKVRPLIFQLRRKPELVCQNNPAEGRTFTDNEVVFGASMRNNVGYGFWQMAYAMQAELNADTLWQAWQAMRAFTGDGGKKLAIRPTTLVVPTALEKVATQLLERELSSDGKNTVTNELKGKLELVVGDYL